MIAGGYEAHRHWTYVYVFADDRAGAEALVEQLDDSVRREAQVFIMGDGPGTFFV